jgi:hypothetical protein
MTPCVVASCDHVTFVEFVLPLFQDDGGDDAA